jgi:COP9 signalosome complex subunit 2
MQRLWFTTAVRLTRLYLEVGESRSAALDELMNQMAATCKQPDGVTDDIIGKGSQLLELYAIEIQHICQRKKGLSEGGYKKVKSILEKCNKANSAVSNPRSMAVIREYAGKIFMAENRFEDAYNELFEAFKANADTGNIRAKLILKYLVLANMFCLSMINPFDSREARAYQDDLEVAAMVRLRGAYDSQDIAKIEEVLNDEVFKSAIDGFMNSYLDKLVYAIKLQALQKLSKAYIRAKLISLGKQLNLERNVLEKMLVKSIQDGEIDGLIDGEELVMRSSEGDDPKVQEAQALLDSMIYLRKEVVVDLQTKWKETLTSTAI